MTDTAQTRAGEAIDGSDFPSREQQAVVNTAALKFGSVAIARAEGDAMRMSTPEGDVIVSSDGERQEAEGLDHMAIMRMRLALVAEAERRSPGAEFYRDGIAYSVLVAAEEALFKLQNWLSSYCGDEQAGEAIKAWYEAKAMRQRVDARQWIDEEYDR